jgi:hypothetical protein
MARGVIADMVRAMRTATQIAVLAAFIVVTAVAVVIVGTPLIRECSYWHQPLLESGQTPMPIPSLDEGGMVCE